MSLPIEKLSFVSAYLYAFNPELKVMTEFFLERSFANPFPILHIADLKNMA